MMMSEYNQLYQPLDANEEDALGWYEKWRGRIYEWVAERSDDKVADVVIVVPDFFMLLVDLARDSRVPMKVKAQIAIAIAYVLSPVDMMPEAVLGVAGLADDATVMAVLLYSLKSVNDLNPAIIREHWRGAGDAIEVIDDVYQSISTNVDKIINSRVWQRIQKTFSNTEKSEETESGRRILSRLNFRRASEGE